MLINGITDIEDDTLEDERLFFNSLEEYVDIKLELKPEIEEFKKKLLIYYLGIVEGLNVKIPELKIGNTVKVHVRIKEGNKERIQVFEGIIIKKQGGGVNATFTVRRISYGVGVEKTFLVHSPM